MTRRTRNFLIDNTTGTVYSGVSSSATATQDKIAAGIKPTFAKTIISKSGSKVVRVTSNKPIIFGREVLITSIRLSVADKKGKLVISAAPQGNDIVVRLRKVNSSNVETIIGTYSITQNTTSSQNGVSISVAATDSLFYDVIEIGTTKPGLGLSVTTGYFG